MINTAVQYRNSVKKHLQCSRAVKSRLLKNFDIAVSAYLDEHSAPSTDELVSAFGPPEEMAKTLMTEVTLEERLSHKKHTQIKRILAVILVAILTISTVYVFYMKEHSNLTSSDEVFEEDINWKEYNTGTEDLS